MSLTGSLHAMHVTLAPSTVAVRMWHCGLQCSLSVVFVSSGNFAAFSHKIANSILSHMLPYREWDKCDRALAALEKREAAAALRRRESAKGRKNNTRTGR